MDDDPGDRRVIGPVGGVVDRRAGGNPDRSGLLAGVAVWLGRAPGISVARTASAWARPATRVSGPRQPASEAGRCPRAAQGEQDGAGVEVGAQVAADRAERTVRERGGTPDLGRREVHRAPAAVERRAGRHAAVRVRPADRLEQPAGTSWWAAPRGTPRRAGTEACAAGARATASATATNPMITCPVACHGLEPRGGGRLRCCPITRCRRPLGRIGRAARAARPRRAPRRRAARLCRAWSPAIAGDDVVGLPRDPRR